MLDRPVPPGAPPSFLALAMNDPLFGHQGFGMREQGTNSDDWAHDFDAWARMHGWMPGRPGADCARAQPA